MNAYCICAMLAELSKTLEIYRALAGPQVRPNEVQLLKSIIQADDTKLFDPSNSPSPLMHFLYGVDRATRFGCDTSLRITPGLDHRFGGISLQIAS
jgi:hypothetical protein